MDVTTTICLALIAIAAILMADSVWERIYAAWEGLIEHIWRS